MVWSVIHVNETEVKSIADLKMCMSSNIEIADNKQHIIKVRNIE